MAKNEKVLERAYFHTGNSGVTVEIKEFSDSSEKHSSFHYRLGVTHGAFGYNSHFDTELLNLEYIDTLIAMLQNTRERYLETQSLDDYRKYREEIGSSRPAHSVKCGIEYSPIYETVIVNEYAAVMLWVGYDLRNPNTNERLGKDIFEEPRFHSSGRSSTYEAEACGDGSSKRSGPKKLFPKDKIGYLVNDACPSNIFVKSVCRDWILDNQHIFTNTGWPLDYEYDKATGHNSSDLIRTSRTKLTPRKKP